MIKIKIVCIGDLPLDFDSSKISRWKSQIYEVDKKIESHSLLCDSDLPRWQFSDDILRNQLPKQFLGDMLVAIVNVPLELNYYTRRLSDNKLIFTFHEIKDILDSHHIPSENVIYRLLYAYSLVYLRYQNRIPEGNEITNFAHDETRGCLFDMNGIKNDIYRSCNGPIICSQCIEKLKQDRVSNETIRTAQREIRKIKKPLYFRFIDFIKKYPIWSLVISFLTAIILGFIGSLAATLFYEKIMKQGALF